MAQCMHASPLAYQKAIDLLKSGESVVLPTETIYGIAALAHDNAAVKSIYNLKNRARNYPLSVCVFTPEQAHDICAVSPLAQRLIDTFWPGALTLVLPKKETAHIAPSVNAHGTSIGLRCPDTPWRETFLSAGFNSPLVLTSANTSGKPNPKSAEDVKADLGNKTPFMIDDGATHSDIGSTIISIKGNTAKILRTGAIPAEAFAHLSIQWGDV